MLRIKKPGEPSLHEAARFDSTEILKKLLESKADVNQKEKEYSMTPLQTAVCYQRPEAAQTLLEHKADVNYTEEYGRTALYSAVENRLPVSFFKTLIEYKADVNKADKTGCSPLHRAAHHDYPELVQVLLENKANVNQADDKNGRTPFCEAVSQCASGFIMGPAYQNTLRKLINYNADVSQGDKKGETPLQIATRKQHKDVVKIITEAQEQQKTMSFR